MCYFPPVSSSSGPLRTVPLPGSPSRSGVSAFATGRGCTPLFSLAARPACSSAPGWSYGSRYLLPLPPQNAALDAISSAETRTMVSHVWLTVRSLPIVRWLMAEDQLRSWSRMAALILFSLSLSSALTDFSCSLVRHQHLAGGHNSSIFDFCSRSCRQR